MLEIWIGKKRFKTRFSITFSPNLKISINAIFHQENMSISSTFHNIEGFSISDIYIKLSVHLKTITNESLTMVSRDSFHSLQEKKLLKKKKNTNRLNHNYIISMLLNQNIPSNIGQLVPTNFGDCTTSVLK